MNPSYKLLGEAMRSSTVRAALKRKANEGRARVDSLGRSEGVEMNAYVLDGTRPKGRPYARIQSDNAAQEWGNRFVERRRIIGRYAAGER